MHTQQSLPFADPTQITGVPTGASASAYYGSRGVAPRFIRSVVEEAGLSRFVYLQGLSGRRYVFSAIKPEQVGLYERAVFAFGDVDGLRVELSCSAQDGAGAFEVSQPIYVHLLSDDGASGSDVMADLSSAVQ